MRKSININDGGYMISTVQFLNELNECFPNIVNKLDVEDKEIQLLEAQCMMLKNLFLTWADNKEEKYIFNLIKEILKDPTTENGKVYEALVYAWLEKQHIRYNPQIHISKEECFKASANGYDADGEIDENNIVFEIKRFGITLPHIETLRRKIQSKIPKEYFLTISGGNNISAQDMQENFFNKIEQLAETIMQKENCIYSDYIYKDNTFGLEFRAWEKGSNRAFTAISEFDLYEWAKNNEFYFMHDASQFCRSVPYILFCSYDQYLAPMFSQEDDKVTFIAFRTLCRRVFMNLNKMDERTISEFDGKAQQGISVSVASKKISAIIFLDVSAENNHHHSRVYVFQNPNADYKIPRYQIDSLFRYNGAVIENFQYDNY